MDKKWTASLTILGALVAVTMQSLLGFGVIPEGTEGEASAMADSLMELVRNIGAFVSVVGLRRAATRKVTE